MADLKCPKCESTIQGAAKFCSDCGTKLPELPPPPDTATAPPAPEPIAIRNRVSKNTAISWLLALLGICIVWFWPIGTVAGVLLIVLASRGSYHYLCSNCGNNVLESSTLCPSCRFKLRPP